MEQILLEPLEKTMWNSLPHPSIMKINCDIAVKYPKTLELLVWWSGNVLYALGRKIQGTSSPTTLEALAIREAVDFRISKGCMRVIIESDCRDLSKLSTETKPFL
ncbi:conserved hypothetical protein [Ricinus communis]|uniref:RNase H type-1 domain-containing protein n=1 Tax=Ricinus communis TaxID=3988 RepID=B9S0Q5_RICCO|nr:conserved hypothetical protein [Ricinus communis]